MLEIFVYSFFSVLVVSLISLIGVLTINIKTNDMKKFLIYFISFSAGALFGDVFLHLLPETVKENGFGVGISLSVMLGIIFSFVLEKVIHWRHCHMPITKDHVHPLSVMNLVGDSLHNFIDGIIIGISYMLSIPVGVATTIAVIFHEIPQEIADFGVLIYGGFSKKKALFMNFLISLTAFLGLFVALFIGSQIASVVWFFTAFAGGNFIYIAGSDLIPELHKEVKIFSSLLQILMFVCGILVMMFLLFLG